MAIKVVPRGKPTPNAVSLPRAYHLQNSLVFVSNAHGIWSTERRPSKRYGQLIQSPRSNLNEMLDEHKDAVYKWISDRADHVDKESEEEEA